MHKNQDESCFIFDVVVLDRLARIQTEFLIANPLHSPIISRCFKNQILPRDIGEVFSDISLLDIFVTRWYESLRSPTKKTTKGFSYNWRSHYTSIAMFYFGYAVCIFLCFTSWAGLSVIISVTEFALGDKKCCTQNAYCKLKHAVGRYKKQQQPKTYEISYISSGGF